MLKPIKKQWYGKATRYLSTGTAFTMSSLVATLANAQLQTDYQNVITNTPSLQNYWNFEDALGGSSSFTTLADVQGGKNGTAVGTVDQVGGLIGSAGSFPGDSDSGSFNNLIEIAGSDTDPLFDLQGSYTIEALVQTTNLPDDNWSGIVSKGDSAWRIARSGGNDYIQGASNGLESSNNTFHQLDNGIWHYVAIRYDQSTGAHTTFFDDASVTEFANPGDSVDTNTFSVMIGGNAEKPEREWRGLIDEVAIYTDALSDADINNRISLLDSDPGAIDQSAIAYWTGSQPTGDFGNDAGWDDTTPLAGDVVFLGKGGDISYTGGDLTLNALEIGTEQDLIGQDSSGSAKMTMTGGTLTIDGGGDTTIGEGVDGELVQTGGKIVFLGDDWELGDRPNGNGTHTLSNDAVLEIGTWVAVPDADDPDTIATAGFFMDNGTGGDDISIGRERNDNPSETAVGELIIEDNAIVRVANDAFIPDVGEGFITMRDNALMHVGDDARAGSADNGVGAINMSGNSKMIVEARFSIADSTGSQVDVNLSDNATVEVGRYLAVGGKDNLDESGVGTLTLDGAAKVDIGAILFRGDLGDFDDIGIDYDSETPVAEQIGSRRRVADDHQLFVGAGPNGEGRGTVHQNGADSVMTVGREANIGHTSTGSYYLRGGLLEVRGDAPIDSDFSIPTNEDGNGNGLSGFLDRGGDLIVGREESGNGLLSVEGGDLDVHRDVVVGLNGTGRLRVVGNQSTANIGAALGFGGLINPAGGSGILEAVITGNDHTVIQVNGGTDGIPGDLNIFDGQAKAGFGEGFRPDAGDYSGDPLEWQIIDFTGTRSGTFALADGMTDGTLSGAIFDLRYDDANGDVFLQAIEVFGAADATRDGSVDGLDVDALAQSFGGEGDWSTGDFNGDGVVDGLDVDVLAQNFGAGPQAGIAAFNAAVPEPTSLALLGLGGLILARRRRSA